MSADGKKKEVRVGRNIASLKSLYIDMDVDAANPNKYSTQSEALVALRDFCKGNSFPAPLVVSSGFGIHAYWPMDAVIPAGEWRILASTFKAALEACGLKTDPTITADASRILRVPGTHNYKRGECRAVDIVRDVTPYPNQTIYDAVAALAANKHIAIRAPANVRPHTTSVLGDNLDKEYAPSDFHKILQNCATMAGIAATGGPGGVIWIHGLAVALATTDGDAACLELSQAYPDFDIDEMKRKIYRLKDQGIGPTLCDTFCGDVENHCDGCIHKGKINSPISLGLAEFRHLPIVHEVLSATTGKLEIIEQPKFPFPYFKNEKGQVVHTGRDTKDKTGDKVEAVETVVCDLVLYPLKCMHNERFDAEVTLWRILRDGEAPRDFLLEHATIAKADALHATLLGKGVYLLPSQVKLMVVYMISYLKVIRTKDSVEFLFSRLGWRDDYRKFVLGSTMYKHDGTTETHQMSEEMITEVPGMDTRGTLDGWKSAVQFYNARDYEAHRIMMYSGFGSLLLHMTGHKGAILAATGEPGAGKTTAMLVSNSIFGNPDALLVGGNTSGTTENALYALLAARNHIPMSLDEVTRMDLKVLGRFCLAMPQGKEKIRLLRSGKIAPNTFTWGNIVQMTANTDMYSALAQSRADASAESVRLFQLHFTVPDSRTKTQADQFIRDLREHYGHAGGVFVKYVVENYEVVKKRVENMVAFIDETAEITSGERFWSGLLAATFVGALCARKLGLIDDFPVEQDIEWAIGLIVQARKGVREHISSAKEVLSEFLEATIGETLVINMTQGSNIAPRIEQAPRGSLAIRHELDAHRMYIMKSAFKKYCEETGANYSTIQRELEDSGVLMSKNKQVTLGKGTDLSKGQVRCWEIDMSKISVG